MSCGQALKERRSRLWKWNPARLICRPFRAGSIFMHFLGFRFAPPQAIFQVRLRRLRASVLGHDQKQVNG